MSSLLIAFPILVLLISLNALYVLAEFSAVSSRRARLTEMAETGNLSAETILKIVENPNKLDTFVATSQVGITISSLILGFYGQAQLSSYLVPVFSRLGNLSNAAAFSVSATTILITLTFFQVLFGELIPKNLGIQEPERFSTFTLNPMRLSATLLKPIISLFNGSGILLMKVLGIAPTAEHGHIHSPEEIAILIEESGKGGVISDGEYRLLTNTMRMRGSIIRNIMIPRSQMLACPDNLSLNEIMQRASDSPYSRIPIFHESTDNIIGIVHIRDLFCLLNSQRKTERSLNDLIRPVHFFPETVLVKEVFSELQRTRNQVAIILDEYGGTSGMVTLEDLVEEIFGDIQDEFDEEAPNILILGETGVLILGNTPIEEINALLGLKLPHIEAETIGGLIANILGRIPEVNDRVLIDGHKFTVHQMEGRAVLSTIMSADTGIIEHFRIHQ